MLPETSYSNKNEGDISSPAAIRAETASENRHTCKIPTTDLPRLSGGYLGSIAVPVSKIKENARNNEFDLSLISKQVSPGDRAGSPIQDCTAGNHAQVFEADCPRSDELFVISLFDLGDVELLHLEHHLKGSLISLGFMVGEQFIQFSGNDLPGQAVFVFQPAALLSLFISAL